VAGVGAAGVNGVVKASVVMIVTNAG
jgi:hypothetical protein